MKRFLLFVCLFCGIHTAVQAESKAPHNSLRELQQQFVDLKFGMFIHFNMATFNESDWGNPDAPLELFAPMKMDCKQWARAAKSAKMRYGCLTTKHHNGFCLWDTKTTDYNAMNTPLKRDVVKEYAEDFRKEGLKVMLYFSILDIHHQLRPGCITQAHVQMVKEQLTELFTNYGEITAIIIDGWDAPWSRISYEDIPFNEIYALIKKLQPDCLVMDLNAAKYPSEALFYTDIKSYEQNAGQHISKETNTLPALSCLPINASWFWKESFPISPVKDPKFIIEENINPMNRVDCNFILNVAPNRDGLIDANVMETLQKIGQQWDDKAVKVPALSDYDAPIIMPNLAKYKCAYSSWSSDMQIMDFANDDNFRSKWMSDPQVDNPWYMIDFGKTTSFNTIVLTDLECSLTDYAFFYENAGEWFPIPVTVTGKAVKVYRFDRLWGNKIKVEMKKGKVAPSINELGIYDEIR